MCNEQPDLFVVFAMFLRSPSLLMPPEPLTVIQQHDLLLPALTVAETLMFSALMSLPSTAATLAVDETLRLLELTHVKDNFIDRCTFL